MQIENLLRCNDFSFLGKDEVASSNLASSSKNNRPSERMAYYFWKLIDRFE